MGLPRSRRTFLADVGVAGLAGIAGCVGSPGSSRGATDVIIHNVAEVSRTVDLTVTQRGDTSPTVETSLDMDPHSSHKINNQVIMDSDYDVEVTYSDETRDAPYSETQEWTDAGQPLRILLDDQIVFAVQVG
jgi:hypothetical protein